MLVFRVAFEKVCSVSYTHFFFGFGHLGSFKSWFKSQGKINFLFPYCLSSLYQKMIDSICSGIHRTAIQNYIKIAIFTVRSGKKNVFPYYMQCAKFLGTYLGISLPKKHKDRIKFRNDNYSLIFFTRAQGALAFTSYSCPVLR